MKHESKTFQDVVKVLAALKGKRFDRVFFIACGGSSALMCPSAYLVDAYSRKMAGEYLNSNEFIYRSPRGVDEQAVVILCSQEGKTPETVAAAQFAAKKGATIITLAMREGTPLQETSDLFVEYGYYENCDMIDTSYGAMYLLTAGLIDIVEGTALLDGMTDSLLKIDSVVKKAKEDCQAQAMEFANACQDDRILYSLASGCNYSQAYVFCNCYMMEMQWINAIPIHAGEFFHGPFEIIDQNSPVIMLMGRDGTRFLEDRALSFLKKFTERLFVIDAKDYDFGDIDPQFEGFVAVLLLNNICREFSKAIAKVRNHSLEIRRYMHLMDY